MPVALRLLPGAAGGWAAALAQAGVPRSDDPAGPHWLAVGSGAALVDAVRERLQACQGQPAGPVSALGPLPDAATLAALTAQGLSGWWPWAEPPGAAELAAGLAADQARWQREQGWREDLARARAQLDERRWVDRAKGVLMQSRGLSEDEAFRLLRGAAMSAGLRMGDVSRAVTEAAQWAEAVNRSGRLRMLSQRVLKLAAQRLDGVDSRKVRAAQGMAIGQVDEFLALLRALPVLREAPAPAAALDRVAEAWGPLKSLLMGRASIPALERADAAAEVLLQQAEALTEAVEAGGARRSLRLVNLCGRQRMRVQRLAKQALLAAHLDQPQRLDTLPALMDDFEATLLELERAPLGGPAVRETLAAAREQWLNLLRGLRQSSGPEGRLALAVASDALLDLFDRLTADYEHSLQMIMS